MKLQTHKFAMMMMVVVVAAGAVLAACGSNDDSGNNSASNEPDPALADLAEAAKGEDTIVDWGPIAADEFDDLMSGFSSQYPGMSGENFEIIGHEAATRVEEEIRAGETPEVDILGPSTIATMSSLLDNGLVLEADLSNLGLPPESLPVEGKAVVAPTDLIFGVSYNTNEVSEDDAPKSFEELADPKWKGRIAVEERGLILGYMGVQNGENWVRETAESLQAQDPILVSGGGAVDTAVTSGEAAIGVGTYLHAVDDAKADGAPMDWAKFPTYPADPQAYFVLKDAPHANAALLFAAWTATESGQSIASDYGKGLAAEGSDYNAYLADAGTEIFHLPVKDAQKALDLAQIASDILLGK